MREVVLAENARTCIALEGQEIQLVTICDAAVSRTEYLNLHTVPEKAASHEAGRWARERNY